MSVKRLILTKTIKELLKLLTREKTFSTLQGSKLKQLTPEECITYMVKNQANSIIYENKENKFIKNIHIESNYLASNHPIEDRLSFSEFFPSIRKCFDKNFEAKFRETITLSQLNAKPASECYKIFAAVFDGHLGSRLSEFLNQHMFDCLSVALSSTDLLQRLETYLSTNPKIDAYETILSVISYPKRKKSFSDSKFSISGLPSLNWDFWIEYISSCIKVQTDIMDKLSAEFPTTNIHETQKSNIIPNHINHLHNNDDNKNTLYYQHKEPFICGMMEHAFTFLDTYITSMALKHLEEFQITTTSSPNNNPTSAKKISISEQTINTENKANIIERIKEELLALTFPKSQANQCDTTPNKNNSNIGINDTSHIITQHNLQSQSMPKTKKETLKQMNQWVNLALSGSCALVAYIDYPENNSTMQNHFEKSAINSPSQDEGEPPTIYIANTGDSRAVIGSLGPNQEWLTTKLSYKHYGENSWELKRLYREHPSELERSWLLKGGRLLGFLMPTRSFGDAMLKWPITAIVKARKMYPHLHIYVPPMYRSPPYLTARPEVLTHVLRSQDKFLVLATDGLWDFLHTRQVVKILGDRWMAYKKHTLKEKSDITQSEHQSSLLAPMDNDINISDVPLVQSDVLKHIAPPDDRVLAIEPNALKESHDSNLGTSETAFLDEPLQSVDFRPSSHEDIPVQINQHLSTNPEESFSLLQHSNNASKTEESQHGNNKQHYTHTDEEANRSLDSNPFVMLDSENRFTSKEACKFVPETLTNISPSSPTSLSFKSKLNTRLTHAKIGVAQQNINVDDINGASWLMAHALSGYTTGFENSSNSIALTRPKKYVFTQKAVSHHSKREQKTTNEEKNVDQNRDKQLIGTLEKLDWNRISALLKLPPEISRDFRDDMSIIVIYFD